MTPKKISKKLIREKLRDKTFMKWVSKVRTGLGDYECGRELSGMESKEDFKEWGTELKK